MSLGNRIVGVLLYIIHYFSRYAKNFKQNTSKFVQKAFCFKNYIVSRRKLFFREHVIAVKRKCAEKAWLLKPPPFEWPYPVREQENDCPLCHLTEMRKKYCGV